MAAQFESVKFSIMVMTTIPFSLVGSFGLLKLTGVSISMTSLLGFLILVGTVVNNGILYVDTVNQYAPRWICGQRSSRQVRPVSDRF